jgi:3-deoxy-D-manno-octulosonate 8-phosphate phosphatase (KDO 8-P phosphatase)
VAVLTDLEVAERAARIKLLLLDVDGVLTDGTVQIFPDGYESKAFYIRDGAGIVMLQRAGIRVGLLSGRPSGATTRRAAELRIDLVVQDGTDKHRGFKRILKENGLDARDVAYMGDDLLDLPILKLAGLATAPADATREILDEAHWVSTCAGGRGAVRELAELLLRTQRHWNAVIDGLAG